MKCNTVAQYKVLKFLEANFDTSCIRIEKFDEDTLKVTDFNGDSAKFTLGLDNNILVNGMEVNSL